MQGAPDPRSRRGNRGCVTPYNQRIFTPHYNVVSVGCRHPRTVPLAFRVSAQFDGLALMSVPTWLASPPSWAVWRPTNATQLHRRTRGACRSRLGSLPAHAANQAHPRHPNADSKTRDSGGDIRCPHPEPNLQKSG